MAPFDPYHKWLGIPPEQQPPDHYRLLGINQFEGDASVISNAADQRMAFLKSVQTGQHVQFSQDLLNEVAQAKLCLLKADKKLAYDSRLRQQAAKTDLPAAPVAVPPPDVPKQQPPGPQPAPPRPVTSATPRINTSLPHHRRPSHPARRLFSPGRILILLVLAAGVFSGAYLWLRNTTPTLAPIANVIIDEDAAERRVKLTGITAGGGESQALRVTVSSDNPKLIPALAVAYTSPDSTGSLTFRPGANQFGTASVRVTVEDGGLDNNLETAEDYDTFLRTFKVTVRPVNDPPTLVPILDLTIPQNSGQQTIDLKGVTAGGGESQILRVTASSSDTTVIPHPTVTYTSPQATAELKFVPAPKQSGTATITVTVEDGGGDNNTFNHIFDVTVTLNLDQPEHADPDLVDSDLVDSDLIPLRLPVPDKEAQKTSHALFDDTFKESYDKAARLEAPQKFDALKALAREIFSLHADEDDPVTRFVLLDNAVGIATESGDPDLTTEIIDEMSTQFKVDDLSLRVTAVNRWEEQLDDNFRGEPLLQKRLQLLNLILPLAERAESEHRYRIAAQLHRLASKLAKNSKHQNDLRKRAGALENKAKHHDRMMRLKDELESPDVDSSVEDTAKKHLTLGAYLCFELDDWEQGLIHLAASNSGELSQIARLDLDNRGNSENAEAIGHRWWELKLSTRFSKYKALPKARAAHWYALAIGDKKGVARKKLLNRIEEAGFVLDESGLFLETAPSLPSNLNDGLVAYYPFNGNARDESGNGNHGQINKPLSTMDRFGNPARAYFFNGVDAFINLGDRDVFDFGTSDFSFSLWLQASNPEVNKYLIGKYDGKYGIQRPAYGVGTTRGTRSYAFFGDGSTTRGASAFGTVNLADKSWHHMAVVYDRTSNMTIFIDGSREASADIRTQQNAISNAIPLYLGAIASGQNFRGAMDDIRIYNRALSAEEVKALYDFERTPPPKPTKHKPRLRRKSTTPPLAVAPFDGRQAKAHQAAWARHLGTRVEISNSIGMKLKLVPPGDFTMGSPESEEGRGRDETQHLVQITQPFYLSAGEVTQAQYRRVMGSNPSNSKGPPKPVEMVNWHEAVAFCGKLSDEEGVEYRLPTEAEWEYACRAGATTAYSFGNDVSELGKYAWHSSNSTHPVGELKPNAWGLFDMHGNVYEWCQDRFGKYETKQVLVDPKGPASGSSRMLRGGAFSNPPDYVRAAGRAGNQPDNRDPKLGFRLARTISRIGDETIRPVGAPFDKPKIPSLRPNLTKGLVAYYPFNGNARDESGNGNHGSLINGGSFTEDRNLEKRAAFSLDGDNHSIQFDELGPFAPTTTQGMSVSFWATRNAFASVLTQYPSATSPPRNNFFINLEPGDNDHYDWNISGNGIGVFRGTPRHYSNDLWQHWFVQIFPGEKGVKVYVNGKLEVNGFNELRGKEVYVKDKPGKFSLNAKTTSTPFYVGHMNGNPQKDGRGAVDDIRIYDRALSAGEVRELYESEKSRP